MTKTAQDILADALGLPPGERAELAAEILASLDGPADPDVQAAWDEEIRRRIEDIDAGRAELVPWEEVKRRIERDILRR